MEPPSKRLRLDPSRYHDDDDDEENQDELSMTPAQFDAIQDPMYQLDKSRAKAATRLKSTFEDIFAKYGKDFDDDDGDVINFYTDEIEVDNGHLKSLENRKDDDAAEDAVSSDGEGRASNGKSASRGEKSRPKFKPPIPANRTKLSQTPQTQSPWDTPPGLGLYRLPSLSSSSSSSPYGAYPPFDFGHSAHGNTNIDPAWQTPDLPVPPPCHQHSQFTGVGRNTFVSFGGHPHQAVRRLASAKSFLQRTASTSSGVHDDDTEDDDIDGGSTQVQARHGHSESHMKVIMPSEPHEPVDGSTQHPQTGASRQKTSPIRTKKGRPRKSNACKPASPPNEQTQNEPRQLAPNERRIEIIFPMMKHLFLTERGQATDIPAPVIDGSPDETEIEQVAATDESIETTLVPQSIESHEDVVSDQSYTDLAVAWDYENARHTAQLSLELMRACGSPEPQDSQSKQTREPIELSSTHTWPSDEQCLEHACVGASQDLEHSQTVASETTVDTFTLNIQRIEQESDRISQGNATPSSEQLSSVSGTSVDEERTACDTNLENAEGMLVDQCNPDEVSLQPLSPTQSLRKHSADATTETLGSATTEDIIITTAISPEPESSHYYNEDVLLDEQYSSPVKSLEEETLPPLWHAVNTTTAPRRTIELEDVFVDSEIPHSHETRISSPERGAGSRSPEPPSAIHSTPEPELHADPDHPTPVPEASDTCEDREYEASNQPSLSNVLANEIDGLQLGSDNWDAPRSPSLGTRELPDEDLSVLPTRADAHSTSELVLRISKYKTRSAVQNNAGTGRSPSPELGTPVGPEIVRGAASGTTSGTKAPVTPTTPTRKRGPRGTKPASSRKRSPSSKRFPLSSLLPADIDDESEDELSLADPFSGVTSRFNSPFSRTSANASPRLPPLLSTPRKRNRKNGLLVGSPPSARTPNRVLGSNRGRNVPPATDSRAGRSQTRRRESRAVNSSPLARRVAERLLSSPTKRHRATPTMSPGLVASPNGTLRRCGEDGFVCERAFCLTCCI